MDLQRLTDILEEIFKESLEERRYKFGLSNKRGLSNSIASGSLRNSVRAISKDNEVYIETNDYFKFIESGRLRNKKGIPTSELEKWISQRGLSGKTKDGKRMTNKQLSFAIQTNIKKFGIPARPILDNTINKIYNSTEISEILGDVSVDELIKKLNEI